MRSDIESAGNDKIGNMKCKELKDCFKLYFLPVSITKIVLISRLVAHFHSLSTIHLINTDFYADIIENVTFENI